jgi:hypothetical protein
VGWGWGGEVVDRAARCSAITYVTDTIGVLEIAPVLGIGLVGLMLSRNDWCLDGTGVVFAEVAAVSCSDSR